MGAVCACVLYHLKMSPAFFSSATFVSQGTELIDMLKAKARGCVLRVTLSVIFVTYFLIFFFSRRKKKVKENELTLLHKCCVTFVVHFACMQIRK